MSKYTSTTPAVSVNKTEVQCQFLKFEKCRKKEGKTVITAAGKPKREPEIVVFEDPAKRKEKVDLIQISWARCYLVETVEHFI